MFSENTLPYVFYKLRATLCQSKPIDMRKKKCTYFMVSTMSHVTPNYHKISDISCILVGSKIVDNSDVVGASPVGAAPTTSSFST